MSWKQAHLLSVFMICATCVILLAMLKQNMPGYVIEHVWANSLRGYLTNERIDIIQEKMNFEKTVKNFNRTLKRLTKKNRKCIIAGQG